jgi:hypothetical protein
MRNVASKSFRGNQNTHFMSTTLSRKSSRLLGDKKKYGTARLATDKNIIRRMRFACWITKATGIHSEHVIPIGFT